MFSLHCPFYKETTKNTLEDGYCNMYYTYRVVDSCTSHVHLRGGDSIKSLAQLLKRSPAFQTRVSCGQFSQCCIHHVCSGGGALDTPGEAVLRRPQTNSTCWKQGE